MRNHKVEIGDTNGNAAIIFISTPNAVGSLYNNQGNWRAIDKGYIRYNDGYIVRNRSDQQSTTSNLVFYTKASTGFGLWFDDYEDIWSVNDSGTGSIYTPWCLKLKPGKITWTLLD